ncbi:MAG TPA: hypothetical protein VKI44_08815 [Acetobacteraceae bacterium]|nr:hypothetical protein [Acetobacteraceae bacterium]
MHDYEIKFLVQAYVSTESADLGKTAARVRCSAKTVICPGDPPIELKDFVAQWLQSNERDEEGRAGLSGGRDLAWARQAA